MKQLSCYLGFGRQKMSKFRWAYIGSGNIAYSTARQITAGEHEIVSVYSRNFEKAKAFAEKFSAKAYDSFEEAVFRNEVDGVYIATPHTSHVDYAVRAMQGGKSVLCEKPVGVNGKDVEILINTSKETGVYFCEAMWTWFSDVALTVKKWVNSGKIGKVKEVKINYAFPGRFMSKDSRVRMPETAGGALLDIGIYPITYCYNLFGFPKKIECTGKIKDGIDVAETVILSYDGFRCVLKMSLYSLKESCVIKGTEGKITFPTFFHMASKVVLKNGKGKTVYNGKTDYLVEFSRAADEIRSGKAESDYIPFTATADCMKIMDECRRQMKFVYPFEK